jgi:long-subunit fatty acid transport protein
MIVMPKNWKDSYSINAGLHYQLTDSIGLMAGIIHDKSAVPDSTLEPSVPDGGSNAYCLGIDFKNKNLSLSAAYNYQKIRSRTKNNAFDDNLLDGVVNPLTSANGQYRTVLHVVGISIAYRF